MHPKRGVHEDQTVDLRDGDAADCRRGACCARKLLLPWRSRTQIGLNGRTGGCRTWTWEKKRGKNEVGAQDGVEICRWFPACCSCRARGKAPSRIRVPLRAENHAERRFLHVVERRDDLWRSAGSSHEHRGAARAGKTSTRRDERYRFKDDMKTPRARLGCVHFVSNTTILRVGTSVRFVQRLPCRLAHLQRGSAPKQRLTCRLCVRRT